jgi:GNAT superfamily N-acetyltransferase
VQPLFTLTLNRLLSQKFKITTMATHPAYWSRGHASKLANWGLELADIDGVAAGVSAARMGAPFFSHLGFKLDEVVEVKGYKRQPESLFVWIGTREAVEKEEKL